VSVQVQLRHGTAAAWTAANPTLASGEAGVETDTLKMKIGNGATAWNSLAYLGSTLYQPLDSDLTAIAAIATTAFGRSLLAAANAGALQTLAGTVIGTNVQAWDTDLDAIAALGVTNDSFIQGKAGVWSKRTVAQVLTDLAAAGTTFQPLDADLSTIAGLTATTDNFLQAKASAWASRTPTQVGADLAGLVTPAAHGISVHTNVTRYIGLLPSAAFLDGGTRVTLGTVPDAADAIALANATTQGCYWLMKAPDDWESGNLFVRPDWVPGSTDAVAHTVRWSVTVARVGNASNITAAGTTTTYTGDSAARTANILVGTEAATDTGVAPTNPPSQYFKINLRRIGADANDTYVGVVNLLGLVVSYLAEQ
jgi:hypothetical protein